MSNPALAATAAVEIIIVRQNIALSQQAPRARYPFGYMFMAVTFCDACPNGRGFLDRSKVRHHPPSGY